MGLPALSAATMYDYIAEVRGLLNGDDVLFREGERERWIRLLHGDRERGFINLDDFIPIYVAANGPKAQTVAGEIGDGWVTTTQPPESFAAGFAPIAGAATQAGRAAGKPYTLVRGIGCVLQPGESRDSQRVIDRVGWAAMPAFHAAWEGVHGPGSSLGLRNQGAADAYKSYIDDYTAGSGSPEDRRYLDVHEGHLAYLKPGEEELLNEQVLSRTFTGTPEEIIERLKGLEAAGVDNLAIQCVQDSARELIEEFSTQIIAKM